MKNATVGGWLMGLTIAVLVLLVLSIGSDYSGIWSAPLGLAMIAQIVFAIIGANRLNKYE